jgi:hypothetical protein
MGEDTKSVAFQGAGQPPVTPSPVAEAVQGNVKVPEYITREEAQRMAQEASEAAFRKAQGLIDKGNAGTLKQVQGKLKALEDMFKLQEKVGMTVTPEQKDKMKNDVLMQAFTETPESTPIPAGNQPAQVGTQDEAEQDPVTAEAWQMMKDAGITIEDNDPETKTLDQSSPYKFLKSIDAAIAAKKARITSNPQQTQAVHTPTNLGASGLPNSNPIQNITDPRELLRMGLNRSK